MVALVVMVVMVVLVSGDEVSGVSTPAVGKYVTVRNESLNQTTEVFIFCRESNSNSSFDWATVFWSIS